MKLACTSKAPRAGSNSPISYLTSRRPMPIRHGHMMGLTNIHTFRSVSCNKHNGSRDVAFPLAVAYVIQTKFNSTTRNLVIYDEIHMTFSDLVTDHTTSMTNSQISS
jgi:hypothetical protein